MRWSLLSRPAIGSATQALLELSQTKELTNSFLFWGARSNISRQNGNWEIWNHRNKVLTSQLKNWSTNPYHSRPKIFSKRISNYSSVSTPSETYKSSPKKPWSLTQKWWDLMGFWGFWRFCHILTHQWQTTPWATGPCHFSPSPVAFLANARHGCGGVVSKFLETFSKKTSLSFSKSQRSKENTTFVEITWWNVK